MKAKNDYALCYQCGWLGLCTIACPLADPALAIPPESSTHPDIENQVDEVFDIVIENPDASESRPDQPPILDSH